MTTHSTALVGATGLVGSSILPTLLSHSSTSPVTTLARKPLPSIPDPHSRLRTLTLQISSWPSELSSLTPPPQILISALGTTKAAAGSFAKQYEIDHDLNLSLAKAAKDAGAKVYVLISSHGANAKSWVPYTRMKGELEEHVKALGFEKTVIVQPGLIVGRRSETRTAEAVFRVIAGALGRVSERWLKDWWAQDDQVIARAAVKAGVLAAEGKAPEGPVWQLAQADIVRLGRDEWEKAE